MTDLNEYVAEAIEAVYDVEYDDEKAQKVIDWLKQHRWEFIDADDLELLESRPAGGSKPGPTVNVELTVDTTAFRAQIEQFVDAIDAIQRLDVQEARDRLTELAAPDPFSDSTPLVCSTDPGEPCEACQ